MNDQFPSQCFNILAEFTILLADYDIKIPGAVTDNISKEILINIEMEYEKLD